MQSRREQGLRQLILDVKRLKQSRRDAPLCLSIQERLIASISRLERDFRAVTARRKSLRVALNQPGLKVAVRTSRKREIDRASARLDDLKELMFVYRLVGDAIAYIYLDRYDIKPLAFKEGPGFLTGKSGLRLELACLRWVLRKGHIAILNDLTNCLRYADLTVPAARGQPAFFEIKSRKTRYPRDDRQFEKLKEIADYLGIDKPIPLYGYQDQKFHRRSLTQHGVYRLSDINRLMDRTRRSGWARAEVEPGLHYLAFRGRVDPEILLGPITKAVTRPIAMLLSECREAWPSYFPLIFSLRNPEDFLDVVFGRVYVWAVISFEEIRRQLEAVGVAVELEPEDSEWMLKLTHDYNGEPAISKIGTHLMHRLVAEFASLKWLVHELSVLPEIPALEDGGAQDGTATLGSTIDLEERGTDREVTAGSAPGRVGIHVDQIPQKH